MTSPTTNNFVVRMGARWLARVDGVNQQLQLLFLAMTGYGIVIGRLSDLGYGGWILEFLIGSTLGLIVYTYAYNEMGVRNLVSRDRNDLEADWAGPNGLIQAKMTARTLAATQKGGPLTDEERRACDEEAELVFEEHRDGILGG